jgi:translation initiation factor 1
MNRDAKLVYSTDPKWQDEPQRSAEAPGLPPKAQVIKVRREKNGRAGKTVTTLFEFQASDRQRGELAKQLRRTLGCGGTVKGNSVELQGDQLAKVLLELGALGYRPKQAGG